MFNYDSDNSNVDSVNDENICLICWSPSTKNLKLIKMNSLSHFSRFSKKCECNSLIHSDCLLEWINIKKVCPICKEKIKTNKNYYIMQRKTQLQALLYFSCYMCKYIECIILMYLLLLFFFKFWLVLYLNNI